MMFIFSGGRYSDGEDEEEEEDGEYQDEETVEQFEDRVLNKRAGKVEEYIFNLKIFFMLNLCSYITACGPCLRTRHP